ncbi:hypothetical protein AAT19DRAFT_10668 [Rhodotorula toruloides]|uniref:Uncharacterized protein n=1 Tax=Rhodotorula toruloides TaxID=5286 RepID=A0A2S9ZZD4_RHOTO|nr:hypothetical protein AAT19DRAFT_10668 [Rhodotorula toruloides]
MVLLLHRLSESASSIMSCRFGELRRRCVQQEEENSEEGKLDGRPHVRVGRWCSVATTTLESATSRPQAVQSSAALSAQSSRKPSARAHIPRFVRDRFLRSAGHRSSAWSCCYPPECWCTPPATPGMHWLAVALPSSVFATSSPTFPSSHFPLSASGTLLLG